MTKGTIIRTIGVVLVVLNLVLGWLGVSPLPKGEIMNAVEVIAQLVIILAAWWKNNSFTDAAIAADEYKEYLKADER